MESVSSRVAVDRHYEVVKVLMDESSKLSPQNGTKFVKAVLVRPQKCFDAISHLAHNLDLYNLGRLKIFASSLNVFKKQPKSI